MKKLILTATFSMVVSGCANHKIYESPKSADTAILQIPTTYTVDNIVGLPVGGRIMTLGELNEDGCVNYRDMGEVPAKTEQIIVPAGVEMGITLNDATLNLGGCGLNFSTKFEKNGRYSLKMQKFEKYCLISLSEEKIGNVDIHKMSAESFSLCK